MSYSSQKDQPKQEPLLSKMDTGTLQKALAEVRLVKVLGLHCTKPSLSKKKIPGKLTYNQQLADPRWRAKRWHIMARDSFMCVACEATANLHVHHIRYTGYAWEAPSKDLLTLCSACHLRVHKGSLEIITENYPLDGKIIYPIEGTSPLEFDLSVVGATDNDTPYLGINRYGDTGEYFLIDFRACSQFR